MIRLLPNTCIFFLVRYISVVLDRYIRWNVGHVRRYVRMAICQKLSTNMYLPDILKRRIVCRHICRPMKCRPYQVICQMRRDPGLSTEIGRKFRFFKQNLTCTPELKSKPFEKLTLVVQNSIAYHGWTLLHSVPHYRVCLNTSSL